MPQLLDISLPASLLSSSFNLLSLPVLDLTDSQAVDLSCSPDASCLSVQHGQEILLSPSSSSAKAELFPPDSPVENFHKLCTTKRPTEGKNLPPATGTDSGHKNTDGQRGRGRQTEREISAEAGQLGGEREFEIDAERPLGVGVRTYDGKVEENFFVWRVAPQRWRLRDGLGPHTSRRSRPLLRRVWRRRKKKCEEKRAEKRKISMSFCGMGRVDIELRLQSRWTEVLRKEKRRKKTRRRNLRTRHPCLTKILSLGLSFSFPLQLLALFLSFALSFFSAHGRQKKKNKGG